MTRVRCIVGTGSGVSWVVACALGTDPTRSAIFTLGSLVAGARDQRRGVLFFWGRKFLLSDFSTTSSGYCLPSGSAHYIR